MIPCLRILILVSRFLHPAKKAKEITNLAVKQDRQLFTTFKSETSTQDTFDWDTPLMGENAVICSYFHVGNGRFSQL